MGSPLESSSISAFPTRSPDRFFVHSKLVEDRNIRPNVRIHEREFLFVSSVSQYNKIIFGAAFVNQYIPHGREGFYFGASNEYRLYDLAKAYTRALYELGKGKSRTDAIYRRGNAEVIISSSSTSKELMELMPQSQRVAYI